MYLCHEPQLSFTALVNPILKQDVLDWAKQTPVTINVDD